MLYTIEDLQGPNLDVIFTIHQGCDFSTSTIALIGLQVVGFRSFQLKKLQTLHKIGITHNGLSPTKITIAAQMKDTSLYLLGVNCARKITKYSRLIENMQMAERPVPANKFSSLDIHLGMTPSKKGDLESLWYILVYFFRKGKIFDSKDKTVVLKAIEKAKLTLTPEIFCEGLPKEMVEYYSYVRSLKPTEKPDYLKLNKLLRGMLVGGNHSMHVDRSRVLRYDWVDRILQAIEKQQRASSAKAQTDTATTGKTTEAEQKLEGVIDIDKDKNFVLEDNEKDNDMDDDDDESNLDENYSMEVPNEDLDPLRMSINRLQDKSEMHFIKKQTVVTGGGTQNSTAATIGNKVRFSSAHPVVKGCP